MPARRALLRGVASVAIAAAWIAPASRGQNPDSRLIEDHPRIEIGTPPAVAPPVDLRPLRPTQDDAVRIEHDRIDLDLDLKERRERRGGREGEGFASSWVAAAAFVAAGAALLLVIAWVRRRGGR